MSQQKIWIRIIRESDVMRAALEAARLAGDLGLDTSARQMVTTAVSELARNIIKYAGSGQIIIAEVKQGNRTGIEITAQDRGPGIADVEQAMADHFSSGGTLGLGLPGVRRLMDEFEIESVVDKGTKVMIRKWR